LKTKAWGKRLDEGKAINLSLSALGDVISALQRNGFNIWVIILIKVLDALVNLKGITSHSYNPSFILKVVFHSSPGLMRI
jgi:hypothetical protein